MNKVPKINALAASREQCWQAVWGDRRVEARCWHSKHWSAR